MTSLRPNLVKRIERLPKPKNVAGALQPLFEAVSNAIHSTQKKFDDRVSKLGTVIVTISIDRKKDNVWITVEDNGNGLDETNWDAFTTTDTDNKIAIGGKGVGRLLWLDCFESVKIESVFSSSSGRARRKFDFVLANDNQIQGETISPESDAVSTFFQVRFEGIRANGYRAKFPGRGSFIFQHITSHFLPTFIGDRCPRIEVVVGEDARSYPSDIDKIVFRRSPDIVITHDQYGRLDFTMMECDKSASADLKGSHFIHFIAHDRTVVSQPIDGKLGLKYFGEDSNRVFHGVLKGKFLDDNVNQERTDFMFEDAMIERIINDVLSEHFESFLSEPLAQLRGSQRQIIEDITQSYPSVAFGDTDELQARLPSGELSEDAIYGHLSRERFRRDARQAEKIKAVLTRLKGDDSDPATFSLAIAEASQALEDAEQKSLAEYVVRRKVVLDFIEILLEKVRDDRRDSAYQREDLLHSFICPMKVNTIGGQARKVEASSSHDLWIIDERLTFAQYFSSDVEFSALAAAAESDERPDVLIFDYVHGLRQTDGSSNVLLVEFKRPGRTDYDLDENPQLQIQRYIRKLQSGSLADVKGRPIQLNDRTIFHCFIVADIVGKLDEWTYSWQRTPDGRGRIYRPDDGFRGSIELLGWDQLLSDAKSRNKAFFDSAGISGKSVFAPD